MQAGMILTSPNPTHSSNHDHVHTSSPTLNPYPLRRARHSGVSIVEYRSALTVGGTTRLAQLPLTALT